MSAKVHPVLTSTASIEAQDPLGAIKRNKKPLSFRNSIHMVQRLSQRGINQNDKSTGGSNKSSKQDSLAEGPKAEEEENEFSRLSTVKVEVKNIDFSNELAQIPLEECISRLKVDTSVGLSKEEVETRLQKFGENMLDS
eukprot:783130-Amorphochlora_amoeboformis.AAC.1